MHTICDFSYKNGKEWPQDELNNQDIYKWKFIRLSVHILFTFEI